MKLFRPRVKNKTLLNLLNIIEYQLSELNKRPRGLYEDDFFQVFRDIIGFCGKSEAR